MKRKKNRWIQLQLFNSQEFEKKAETGDMIEKRSVAGGTPGQDIATTTKEEELSSGLVTSRRHHYKIKYPLFINKINLL
jgi:hypothetical protein